MSVEARDFWGDAAISPKPRQGYHYNRNANTYMEVGNALGWAMADLLGGYRKLTVRGPADLEIDQMPASSCLTRLFRLGDPQTQQFGSIQLSLRVRGPSHFPIDRGQVTVQVGPIRRSDDGLLNEADCFQKIPFFLMADGQQHQRDFAPFQFHKLF